MSTLSAFARILLLKENPAADGNRRHPLLFALRKPRSSIAQRLILIANRLSPSSPIRPPETPSSSLFHHNRVDVTLGAELGINGVTVGAEFFRNIKHQRSRLDIHFIWHELLMYAGKFNGIAQ